jgi:hypothetical protein
MTYTLSTTYLRIAYEYFHPDGGVETFSCYVGPFKDDTEAAYWRKEHFMPDDGFEDTTIVAAHRCQDTTSPGNRLYPLSAFLYYWNNDMHETVNLHDYLDNPL